MHVIIECVLQSVVFMIQVWRILQNFLSILFLRQITNLHSNCIGVLRFTDNFFLHAIVSP